MIGTFLYTFNHFYNQTIKLIGINTGNLGFYTAGSYEELKNNKNFLLSLVFNLFYLRNSLFICTLFINRPRFDNLEIQAIRSFIKK